MPAGRPSDYTPAQALVVEIYCLRDPDTLALRYIGKAKNAAARFAEHVRDSVRRDYPVYRWMAKLRRDGKTHVLEIMARVPADEWQRHERELIAISRARGDELLNVADGGDQPHSTAEQRSASGKRLNENLRAKPKAMRLRYLKARIGQYLRSRMATDRVKDKLRVGLVKHPRVYACFAQYL